MRFKLELSYVGTDFHGWQRQPNGITVQEVIEDTLTMIAREQITIVGCGRTDTGVHAKYYVAHFDSQYNFSSNDIAKINGILPKSVAILNLTQASDNFHARFDAKRRTYKYYITTKKDPFDNGFAWYVKHNLDIDLMQQAASKLFNYIDFTSFSKLHTDVNNNNCKIMQADIEKCGDKIIITISADRFLRNMVRAIVGTLTDVGKNKISVDDFCAIIEKKDRCEAGQSVPADGLFLYDIEY